MAPTSTSASPKRPLKESSPKKPPSDLTFAVDELLEQMQTRFDSVGKNVMKRMDEMGSGMDELEQSIAELMDRAGLERIGLDSSSSSLAPPRESKSASPSISPTTAEI